VVNFENYGGWKGFTNFEEFPKNYGFVLKVRKISSKLSTATGMVGTEAQNLLMGSIIYLEPQTKPKSRKTVKKPNKFFHGTQE
jgi:hypothetical protein